MTHIAYNIEQHDNKSGSGDGGGNYVPVPDKVINKKYSTISLSEYHLETRVYFNNISLTASHYLIMNETVKEAMLSQIDSSHGNFFSERSENEFLNNGELFGKSYATVPSNNIAQYVTPIILEGSFVGYLNLYNSGSIGLTGTFIFVDNAKDIINGYKGWQYNYELHILTDNHSEV